MIAQYLIHNEKIGGETFVQLMKGELISDTSEVDVKSTAVVENSTASDSTSVPEMPTASADEENKTTE